MPAPVGSRSLVQRRLNLGIAAPGPGRARRGAVPARDAGDSREDMPLTGLEAPT